MTPLSCVAGECGRCFGEGMLAANKVRPVAICLKCEGLGVLFWGHDEPKEIARTLFRDAWNSRWIPPMERVGVAQKLTRMALVVCVPKGATR